MALNTAHKMVEERERQAKGAAFTAGLTPEEKAVLRTAEIKEVMGYREELGGENFGKGFSTETIDGQTTVDVEGSAPTVTERVSFVETPPAPPAPGATNQGATDQGTAAPPQKALPLPSHQGLYRQRKSGGAYYQLRKNGRFTGEKLWIEYDPVTKIAFDTGDAVADYLKTALLKNFDELIGNDKGYTEKGWRSGYLREVVANATVEWKLEGEQVAFTLHIKHVNRPFHPWDRKANHRRGPADPVSTEYYLQRVRFGRPAVRMEGLPRHVTTYGPNKATAYNPNNKKLFKASGNRYLVWRTASQKIVTQFSAPSEPKDFLLLSPGQKKEAARIAVAGKK